MRGTGLMGLAFNRALGQGDARLLAPSTSFRASASGRWGTSSLPEVGS